MRRLLNDEIFARRLAQSLSLVAICIMILTAPRIAAEESLATDDFPWWILPGGILSMWLALRLGGRPFASLACGHEPEIGPASSSRIWAKRAAITAAVAGMLVITEINIRGRESDFFKMSSYHGQFAILVSCCLLLIWGFDDRRFRLPRWRNLLAARRWELSLVALLTLIALVLRLHDLEAIQAFVDELNFIIPSQTFSSEANIPLLQPMSSIAAFPRIYPYLQWLATPFTGSALIGLRIPSAILGAFTVPALYLLGKQLFSWQVGFVAALLLATFPVHLQWSRLGMNNVADSLFGILMLALLARGARRGGNWHFALAGVCLGLTQYFYEGGRLVFLALTGIWFLYLMLLTVWRNLPRRYIAVFLASALIIGGPIYLTLMGMERPITARFEQVRIGPERWKGDLAKVVHEYPLLLEGVMTLFVSRPEHVLYYGGYYPYIHFYTLPALLLGLSVLFWRWCTPGGSLLLIWIFGTILAMTMWLAGNNSSRLLVTMPAVLLVCALGIVEPLRILVAGREWALRPAIMLASLAIAAIQTAFYFDIHIERFNIQHLQRDPAQEIAFWARDLPTGSRIYFLFPEWDRGSDLDLMARTLNPGVEVLIASPLAIRAGYIDNITFNPADTYFVSGSDTKTLTALNERFLLTPLDWTDHNSFVGLNFLAFRAVADRYAIGF